MNAQLEQATEQFEAGDVAGALKTLDSALWTAVGRLDWAAVAAIEHLLTAIWPSTEGRHRRRCEYLLYAAQQNLRAKAGEPAPETEVHVEEPAPASSRASGDLEARVLQLEREVAELRTSLRAVASELGRRDLAPRAAPAARPRAAAEPPAVSVPPPRPRPAEPAAPPRRPAPPPRRPARPPSPPRDWSQLFGARTLAWAGGIVTSLGIVFLYTLAVNRGWIGPVVRVATGGVVSALVFSAGFWLRRRFGTTYAALGAAGAGITGGYATLLAAVALYELLPKEIALFFAAGIAAVGVATALRWSAEMVALLGLVGAILAPVSLVVEDGFTTLGTGFAFVVFAAAAAVAIARRWSGVLGSATVAGAPQIAALVLDERGAAVVVLAALFSLAYVATAITWHRPERSLGAVTTFLVLVSGSVASLASQQLFSGDARGYALLVAAAAYGATAAALLPDARRRDLSSLLAALALSLAAVGLAQVLSGQVLAIAWAAEAALLAWLARRIDEERYQLGALAYLVLAIGHALAVDAPLSDLFEATPDPADGAPTVVAVALAALVFARYAGAWRDREQHDAGALAFAAPLFAAVRGAQPVLRSAAILTAVAAAAFAASLAVLEVAQRVGPDVRTAFERGHAAVDVTWSALALGLLAFSLLRRHERLGTPALALYGVLFAKAVLFDAGELGEAPRAVAFLAIAVAAAVGGFLWQRLAVPGARLDVFAVALVAGSVALAVPGAVDVADGHLWRLDLDAVALLALAAGYGLLAALAFRRERDLSSALSAVALVLAAWGLSELLAGTWLVAAWAAGAALLAWLSLAARELRFALASFGYLLLAFVHVIAVEAPPSDLFVSQRHPGGGVPALLALAAAGLAFAVACRPWRTPTAPEEDDPYGTRGLAFELESRLPLWHVLALWSIAVVAVFAVSLGILEAAQAVSNVSVETAFQRGHSGVSAFWGVLGLALLYAGLVRRRSALRVAGLALFGVTLAKIFLYDLAALSPIARALSFLAVGLLLLAAGFFYQRLSERLEEREPATQ